MFNFNPIVEKVSIKVRNTEIGIKSYILLITLPIKASARKKYKNRNYLTPRDLFKPRSLPSAQFPPNPKKREKTRECNAGQLNTAGQNYKEKIK